MCSIQYYIYHMCSTPHTIGVVWKRCDDITPSLYFIKAGILSRVMSEFLRQGAPVRLWF